MKMEAEPVKPAKKGSSGTTIVIVVVVLVLVIGTSAYALRKKTNDNGGGSSPQKLEAEQKADRMKQFAESRINSAKVTLTDAQKEAIRQNPEIDIVATFSPEQKAANLQRKKDKISGKLIGDDGDVMSTTF